jgi:hypothetical protein
MGNLIEVPGCDGKVQAILSMRTIAGMIRKPLGNSPKSVVNETTGENPLDGRVKDPVSPAYCLTVA